MSREGDSLEEYQIQGTYKPRDSAVSLAGKALRAGAEYLRDRWNREAAEREDLRKNGHILPKVTLDEPSRSSRGRASRFCTETTARAR